MPMTTTDPIELIIAGALTSAKIDFLHESENKNQMLDFYLPSAGTYIECKQFATERTGPQIAHIANVIVIQGRQAAECFAALVSQGANSAPPQIS